ncbi:MAG: hypothetical protein PVSMB2_01140 [Ktedonobacteraceae bacterium]
MLLEFWIFGGVLIMCAIAFLIVVGVGMVRGGNKRTQTDDGWVGKIGLSRRPHHKHTRERERAGREYAPPTPTQECLITSL